MEKDMQFASLDALERLRRLPDDAELTTDEAAVFLRSSTSAVEALRAGPAGPAQKQSKRGMAADGSPDRLCGKVEMLNWHRDRVPAPTMAAPVRKGRLFASVADLTEPAAFWVDPDGAVLGMVEAALASTAVGRIGQFDIEWMSPLDAGARGWASLTDHQSFVRHAASFLHGELSKLSAGLARTAAAAEMAASQSPSGEGEA